jgi:hypothetical protein
MLPFSPLLLIMSSSTTLQLCLTCAGKQRQIVSLDQSSKLSDLYELAQTKFGCDVSALQHGFPPTALERSNDIILGDKLKNQDRVNVVVKEKSNHGGKKAAAAAASGPAPARSKRAAAKQATESFKDVIKAQDAMMREQQSKTKKSGKKRPTTSPGNSGNNNKRPARPPPGIGRRLADGDVVAGSNGPARQSRGGPKISSKDDITNALIGALNSRSQSNVSKILRTAMKSRVSAAHDESLAVAKVAAVQSHRYEISTTGDTVKVHFAKGFQGRGNFEETVQLIEENILKEVVASIYHSEEKDLLRPTKLAFQSPRVFWNLVRLYSASADSIEEALQLLLPDLDWSFLKKRVRELSEKALENQRQAAEQAGVDSEEPNIAAGQEAVQAVEQAMETLQNHDALQRRERAAQAAMARTNSNIETTPNGAGSEDTWTLTTPSEFDEDELRECLGETDYEKYGQQLVDNNIHNWRELAMLDSTWLATTLGLSDPAHVEPWLERAQQESIDEIILELCDNHADAVTYLACEANSGTPRDLSNWRQMPDLLYESAPSLATLPDVSIDILSRWCNRAQRLMEDVEWIKYYATTVE